jgi:hypothetical protein
VRDHRSLDVDRRRGDVDFATVRQMEIGTVLDQDRACRRKPQLA